MSEVARRTATDEVHALASGTANLYSTIKGDTQEARLATLSAVTDSEPLMDHIGETIQLRHVIVQASSVVDEKTGEESDALRTIIIAEDGTAYHAMSKGLFTYLRNLFDIVGNPEGWTAPLAVVPTEKRGRNGFRFLTLKLADVPKVAPAPKGK